MTIRARLNSSRFRRWPLLQNRVMDFNGLARKPLCYRQLSLGAAPSRQLRRSAIRTRFLLAHIGDPFSNQATTLESQIIHMIQELFGQTLRERQSTAQGQRTNPLTRERAARSSWQRRRVQLRSKRFRRRRVRDCRSAALGRLYCRAQANRALF